MDAAENVLSDMDATPTLTSTGIHAYASVLAGAVAGGDGNSSMQRSGSRDSRIADVGKRGRRNLL